MNKLFYLFFLTSCIAMAQNFKTEDIVGSYRIPSNDPQGGQSVMIFENNTFATFYFGGALKGTWEIEGNEIKFKTVSNPKFYLYGRESKTLKDSTHLKFSTEESTLVNLAPKTSDIFRPLFNEGANCFGYPYIYKTSTHLGHLNFGKEYYYYGVGFDIFKFEVPKKFNDLIVIGLQDEYTKEIEFSALYKDGKLYFNRGKKPASKRPSSLEANKEEKAYLNKFMNQELIPETLIYGNEFFPYYDNPAEEELIPYIRIAPIKKEKGQVKVGKNNVFTATCEE